jgi:CDP-diacylglycerol--glycerol-3-phosphate 3-phosphatidyltransferase
MLMVTKTKSFQAKLDYLIDRIFLRFIPHSVTPNQVTLLRFFLTALMFFLLLTRHIDMALIVFAIAACTDFIDGAMARTRNQITDVGKVIDPLADKLLMICALSGFVTRDPIIGIVIIYIFAEIVMMLFAVMLQPVLGKPVGSNVFGKIKFVLQCCAAVLFLVGVLTRIRQFETVAIWIFVVALIFATASILETIRRKLIMLKK